MPAPEPRRISGITAVLALVALLMLLHWVSVVLAVHPWFIPADALGIDLSLPMPPGSRDFDLAQGYRPWLYTWLPDGTQAYDHVPWFGLVCAVTGVALAIAAMIAHLLGARRPWASWALLVVVLAAPFVLPRTWTGVQRSEVWTCEDMPCALVDMGLPVRADELGRLRLDWRDEEPRVLVEVVPRDVPGALRRLPYPWCPKPTGSLEIDGRTLVADPTGAFNGGCPREVRWTGQGRPPEQAFHAVVEVPVAEGVVVYDLGWLPGTSSLVLPDEVVAAEPRPAPVQDGARVMWQGRFSAWSRGLRAQHGCMTHLFVEGGRYHFAAGDSGALGGTHCRPGPLTVDVTYEGGDDHTWSRLHLGERTVQVVAPAPGRP